MVSPTNKAVDSPKTLSKPQDLCQGKCNSTKAVDTPTALTVPQELFTDYFSYYHQSQAIDSPIALTKDLYPDCFC